MIDKFIAINQSLMFLIALTLIVIMYQQDYQRRINDLETRQTNHLIFLEQKVNNVDSKVDTTTNELRHSLRVMEARQGQRSLR